MLSQLTEKEILGQLADYIYPKPRNYDELRESQKWDNAELFRKIKILEGKGQIRGTYGLGRFEPAFVSITPYGLQALDEAKNPPKTLNNNRTQNTISGGKENILTNVNGSGNIINIHKTNPVSIGADHGYNGMIVLMQWLFKALGEKIYKATFIIASILSAVGTALSSINWKPTNLSFETFLPVTFLAILAASLAFYFLPQQSKCKKCGSFFSVINEDRKIKSKEELDDETIINYEESFKCNKCGANYSTITVERRTKATK